VLCGCCECCFKPCCSNDYVCCRAKLSLSMHDIVHHLVSGPWLLRCADQLKLHAMSVSVLHI
jgi:hypothetical protein